MPKLADLLERRTAIETEMRTLYDAAEQAGQDMTGDALESWTRLKAELDDIVAREGRARTRDALDRQTPGRAVTKRDDDGSAWALTSEQRMADYVRATTGQSAEGLSLGRTVRGVITGDWRGAEAERRVMGSGVSTAGGYFIPDPVSANVIDLARNVSVLVAAGALTIPMTTNNMTMVRVISDPTATWRAEGQTISESDATFGAILLSPNSVAALVRVNAELMADAENFAAQLDAQLAAALALKLDHAGLYGIGASAEPLGLRHVSDVNEISMGTNGAVPSDYDDFLDLIRDVELDNGTPDVLIWSPRTKNTMAQIVTGITSDKTKLAPPADFAALRKLVSIRSASPKRRARATPRAPRFSAASRTWRLRCASRSPSRPRPWPAPPSPPTR
jgi:HK97 family phage major capsid protein